MEPIKLIKIETVQIDDYDADLLDLVTKYEPIVEYDDDDNEMMVGIKIIDSMQYDQEDADKDWKQVLGWIEEDQERIDSYGRNWYMFGIRAVATLHFPQENTEAKIIQRIKSPGLFGIESDSDDRCFEEVEEDQVTILLGMLEAMHINVPNDFPCHLTMSEVVVSADYIKAGGK